MNMPEKTNEIPIEMLADIIQVFLAGLKQDIIESDLICSIYPWTTDAYATWTDVMSLRKRISQLMIKSDNPESIALGEALEKMWEACEAKENES